MVISEIFRLAREELGERDASLVIRDVLGITPVQLITDKNKEVSKDKEKTIINYINRIKNNEPLQYVVGSCEFMSLPFDVCPDVLIPRSDTETLVEYIIEKAPASPRILDIGTGSGCIAISLKHYIKNSTVWAMDISEKALITAQKNAQKNKVDINFIHHDIMQDFDGNFDIIVSNPPYIETDVIPTLDENVRCFEPITALDGGTDGLDFYRRIVSVAPSHLCDGGMLCFEVGHTQANDVAGLMSQFSVEIIPDLCGINRVVAGRLISK